MIHASTQPSTPSSLISAHGMHSRRNMTYSAMEWIMPALTHPPNIWHLQALPISQVSSILIVDIGWDLWGHLISNNTSPLCQYSNLRHNVQSRTRRDLTLLKNLNNWENVHSLPSFKDLGYLFLMRRATLAIRNHLFMLNGDLLIGNFGTKLFKKNFFLGKWQEGNWWVSPC